MHLELRIAHETCNPMLLGVDISSDKHIAWRCLDHSLQFGANPICFCITCGQPSIFHGTASNGSHGNDLRQNESKFLLVFLVPRQIFLVDHHLTHDSVASTDPI